MIAGGMGATVSVLDVSLPRLRYLEGIMPANVNLLFSTRYAIRKQIRDADLVIGAVLVPGAKAPALILEDDLKTMKPGSVIVDVAVDQPEQMSLGNVVFQFEVIEQRLGLRPLPHHHPVPRR